MADKLYREIDRKLDLIIDKLGIKDEGAPVPAPRAPRELTAAEQQAIANAPVVPAAQPPADAPRTTAQNAPSTASSVPKDDKATGKK